MKVDNTIVDDVYPQKADFTFYGGIYRDVNFVIVNPVHVDLLDYGSQGVYIVQDQLTKDRAALTVKTRLANMTEQEKKVRLWIEILDDEGKTVTYAAREVTIPERETIVAEVPVVLDNPHLWHGRKDPYLYDAKVSLISYNDMLDEVIVPFGVRYFSVDSEKGFFLNGEPYRLYGVSRHQDRQDKG